MHGAAIASSVSYITESVIIMSMFRKRRAMGVDETNRREIG
jgi:hypothetical protein